MRTSISSQHKNIYLNNTYFLNCESTAIQYSAVCPISLVWLYTQRFVFGDKNRSILPPLIIKSMKLCRQIGASCSSRSVIQEVRIALDILNTGLSNHEGLQAPGPARYRQRSGVGASGFWSHSRQFYAAFAGIRYGSGFFSKSSFMPGNVFRDQNTRLQRLQSS